MSREKIVGPDAVIPLFRQQLAIIKAVKARFESSLFDLRQLVQADLFDSDLEAAKELAGKNFTTAAGALAGVALIMRVRDYRFGNRFGNLGLSLLPGEECLSHTHRLTVEVDLPARFSTFHGKRN